MSCAAAWNKCGDIEIMKKLLQKIILSMSVSMFLIGALTACGLTGAGGTSEKGVNSKITYKYDNSKVMDEVTITKSVYSDGELTIYISDLGEDISFAYFDSDFNSLDKDFEPVYKKGKLTIKGEGAEKISGIKLTSTLFNGLKLRYLDSNQYAILIDYFVDDLGTQTYGDEDAYYSAEEKAAQQAAKEERIREQEENYKAVEGHWESVENNGEYVDIFTDEDGSKWLRQAMYINDELKVEDTYIHTINISEIGIDDYYAYYTMEILDSDGWGLCYRFDLNEDMTAIMDWSTQEPGFIKK